MVKVSTTQFIHWDDSGYVQVVDKHSGWHHRLEGFTVGADGTLYEVPGKGWLAIEVDGCRDVCVEARLEGDELTFQSLDEDWHVVDEWTVLPLVVEIDEHGEDLEEPTRITPRRPSAGTSYRRSERWPGKPRVGPSCADGSRRPGRRASGPMRS